MDYNFHDSDELSKEEMKEKALVILRDKLVNSRVTYLSDYAAANKLDAKTYIIKDIIVGDDRRLEVIFDNDYSIPFTKLTKEGNYKLENRAGRNFIDKVIKYKNENDVNGYLLPIYAVEHEGEPMNIEFVDISEDEIDWLDKNVESITAQIPSNKVKSFYKTFGSGYTPTISNNKWDFAFIIKFKNVEGMPDAIKNVKNKEGQGVDLANKKMNNTNYVATLIKKYPKIFQFGSHTYSKKDDEGIEQKSKVQPYIVVGKNADSREIVFAGTLKQCEKYVEKVEKEEAIEFGEDNPDTFEYYIYPNDGTRYKVYTDDANNLVKDDDLYLPDYYIVDDNNGKNPTVIFENVITSWSHGDIDDPYDVSENYGEVEMSLSDVWDELQIYNYMSEEEEKYIDDVIEGKAEIDEKKIKSILDKYLPRAIYEYDEKASNEEDEFFIKNGPDYKLYFGRDDDDYYDEPHYPFDD